MSQLSVRISPPVLLARKFVSAWWMWQIARARKTGRYAGRHVLQPEQTNGRVRQLVESGRPMMVSRLGSSEIAVWCNFQGVRAGSSNRPLQRLAGQIRGLPNEWSPEARRTFVQNAGFFPDSPEYLQRYAEGLARWLGAADLLAVMFDRQENWALRVHAPQADLGSFMGLEPYLYADPWTMALQGRRVLVVHPFADSIQRQYPARHRLFIGQPVLPDFELSTLRAVQSIGGTAVGYPHWFAALESMQEQIAALNFDVAIIGAGAYGMPLAAFVKALGKQAIHLGGSTQILFGIKGRRWDVRPEVTRFYNDEWTRPQPHEVPPLAQSIEDGCYW